MTVQVAKLIGKINNKTTDKLLIKHNNLIQSKKTIGCCSNDSIAKPIKKPITKPVKKPIKKPIKKQVVKSIKKQPYDDHNYFQGSAKQLCSKFKICDRNKYKMRYAAGILIAHLSFGKIKKIINCINKKNNKYCDLYHNTENHFFKGIKKDPSFCIPIMMQFIEFRINGMFSYNLMYKINCFDNIATNENHIIHANRLLNECLYYDDCNITGLLYKNVLITLLTGDYYSAHQLMHPLKENPFVNKPRNLNDYKPKPKLDPRLETIPSANLLLHRRSPLVFKIQNKSDVFLSFQIYCTSI